MNLDQTICLRSLCLWLNLLALTNDFVNELNYSQTLQPLKFTSPAFSYLLRAAHGIPTGRVVHK